MMRQQQRKEKMRYAQNGYRPQKGDLYIARDPAGSARDTIRDLNRKGYTRGSSGREPFLQKNRIYRPAKNEKKLRQMTLAERLTYEVRRDRKAASVCLFLVILIFILSAVWMQKIAETGQARRAAAEYKAQTVELVRQNEILRAKLEQASSDLRIRNKAQNELGMLRRERAERHEIYVQLPEKHRHQDADAQEPRAFEPLDVFLSLLHFMHIGE